MDNSWRNNMVHEHSIYSMQQRARNLTTWQAYPIPGRLVEVPYPLDPSFKPVDPCNLSSYALSHVWDMPKCLHSENAVVVTKEDPATKTQSKSLQCAFAANGAMVHFLNCKRSCGYLVDLNNILNGPNTDFCLYGKRLSKDSGSDASLAAEVELLEDILGASISSPAAPSYGSACFNPREGHPTPMSSSVDAELISVLSLPNAGIPAVGSTVDPPITYPVEQGSEGGYPSPMHCDFDFGNSNNRPAYGFIAPQQTVLSLAPSYSPHETHWEGGDPVTLDKFAREQRLSLGWTRNELAAIAEDSEPKSDYNEDADGSSYCDSDFESDGLEFFSISRSL